jgi:DNA-binding protein H-NS
LVSAINKNLESLSIFYEYKVFLDSLANKEQLEEMERKKEQKRRRKEEQERMEQFGSSQSKNFMNQKGQNAKDGNRKKAAAGANAAARNDENDVNIPQKLREVIEESDDEYPLHFNDPDELLEIFSTLEEKNLFLI